MGIWSIIILLYKTHLCDFLIWFTDCDSPPSKAVKELTGVVSPSLQAQLGRPAVMVRTINFLEAIFSFKT